MPARYARMSGARWLLAIAVFGSAGLTVSESFAIEVSVATALAGLSASAAVYLVVEWLMRPAFALALGPEAPADARSLGIGPRLLLTWVLCSGVPILMLALVPVARDVDDPHDLIAPTLFAAGMALVTGLVATKIATQAVTDPIRALRRAVDSVADGDLGASVAVDDGSEIGRLEAGFNAMVAGLRERELIRELWGRQVGPDVARATLEDGAELGGRRAQVTALYVDVVGSTALAEREDPERVVALLNEFFAAVVEVVDAHCGLVNKFEGDAALCVFGAPVALEDHAGAALRAARELQARARRARRRAVGGDRRRLGRRRRGLRRRGDPLRVHGRRRPGQRGGAAQRGRQGPAGAAARLGRRARRRGPLGGGALARRRRAAPARAQHADAAGGARRRRAPGFLTGHGSHLLVPGPRGVRAPRGPAGPVPRGARADRVRAQRLPHLLLPARSACRRGSPTSACCTRRRRG